MQSQSAGLESVFHALGDPTRLGVLAQLAEGPATVSQLAARYHMALPSFVQHLKVLEDSGLITSSKKGRVRTCKLKPQAMSQAEGWLAEQRAMWEARLDRFDSYVRKLHAQEANK
jgi:DNA-binding transcriptional ArsR family regulator